MLIQQLSTIIPLCSYIVSFFIDYWMRTLFWVGIIVAVNLLDKLKLKHGMAIEIF